MSFNFTLGAPDAFTCQAYTLRDIIFRQFPHRPEASTVIRGHRNEEIIEIKLGTLRRLVGRLIPAIREKGLCPGDTVLLASYYTSNELANALLFATFACLGIRVFIPMYPEADEFDSWHALTRFKCVIIPYRELLQQKDHDREKEVIASFTALCRQKSIPLWDAYEDFGIHSLLQSLDEEMGDQGETHFDQELIPETEAVIFTTSGTSGKSKLVVYNQGAFSLSCQSWQQAGLFDAAICGNAGFTPLFTHTIGIRSFINALWSGHPVCIMVVDWFLNKPEEARYLLLRMMPGHITGGPALFSMLNEFFRQYPELKTSLRRTLKTLISIGAPYNSATALQLKSALGLELYNAFGTTETQMVLLNKSGKDGSRGEDLGVPLPGVSIGLTETGGLYEMHIRSPFQSARVLNEPSSDPYFRTGDLVSYGETEGSLAFANRKGTDFLKDDFGVKIPVGFLEEYYGWLHSISVHIEWLLLDKKPGLGALIFVPPTCTYSAKEISEWLKSRNETLLAALQPFEFTHRHLERFSVVKGEPPYTRKGTVSRKQLYVDHEELIRNLRNPYVSEKRIEAVETDEKSLLYKFSDPRLASLLESLKIDVRFERGQTDFLYYKRNGKEVEVLDLVGGFGANLLGHNHPFIKSRVLGFLQSGQPALNAQGSLYHYPALLAKELNKLFRQRTGKYFKVQFGNTGSEVMEIALHHAYFEWWTRLEKRRDEQLQLYGALKEIDVAALWDQNLTTAREAPAAIMVINDCFHGYSSGARSLLNDKKQRNYFPGLLRTVPLHVNDKIGNWKEQVDSYLQSQCIVLKTVAKIEGNYTVLEEKVCNIIASVVEPVRGEGGISETNEEVINFLAAQKFPLIADEIQCGLGRTGTLPSYPQASYYLLGKSLGGGYEKISALLIEDDRFKPSFPQYYTSTFANGEMAACTALAALEVIQRENVPQAALRKGNAFIQKLQGVVDVYPDIIESVKGRGLMLGVHFNKGLGKRNTLLRVVCENDLLGFLVAGWLFHNKDIRVLPSLSQPGSLRVEPSVYISEESMDQFCEALSDWCCHCRKGEMYELHKFLMNDDPYLDRYDRPFDGVFPVELEEPVPGALKVGFIGNFTLPPRELVLIEPDLQKASDTGLRILFDKMQTLLDGKPIRLFRKNLMKGRVHFTFYILPFDTAHLELVSRWGKKRYYISRIQEAVNKLSREGSSHISLGAHTSILSGNGLYLAEPQKVKVLTGNTLTVASSLYHLEQYWNERRQRLPGAMTIAVLGAHGNIGSGLAGCLDGEQYAQARVLLVGNNLKKLELVRKRVFAPGRDVECTTDLFRLREADIIISCTNTNDPLVFSHHLHRDKEVFIIDIAVPGSVSEEVKQMANVQFCKKASTVFLSDEPDFLISTHTPTGKVFCCAGEVMLAALYDVQCPLKGHLVPESIKEMMKLAVEEEFFNPRVYAPSV